MFLKAIFAEKIDKMSAILTLITAILAENFCCCCCHPCQLYICCHKTTRGDHKWLFYNNIRSGCADTPSITRHRLWHTKKVIKALVFKKNANLFKGNLQKSPKILIITLTPKIADGRYNFFIPKETQITRLSPDRELMLEKVVHSDFEPNHKFVLAFSLIIF
jgi:hypothetical protein